MIKRRDFLKTLGLGSAVGGLTGPLGLSEAFGLESDGAPKRLIILSSCHGWTYDGWKMRPGNPEGTSPWEADFKEMAEEEFSPILAPLYKHRERMLALDGLSLASAELDMDGFRHIKGWIQAWTGNWAYFNGAVLSSQAPSIDQIVAAHLAREDRLPSIEISVECGGMETGRPVSHVGFGPPLPAEISPERLWTRIFGPSQSPNPFTGRHIRGLNYAREEYQALVTGLGQEERFKLDHHFDLVMGLRKRLDAMATLSCPSVPLQSTEGGPSTGPESVQKETGVYDQRFDAFAELVGAAFSCDITRVVSMTLGEQPTADFGWDHKTDSTHHGLAHEIYNDADCHQAMTDYAVMHANQVSRLVSLLESTPDVDGRSVMDNTLIVWGSELADGWHGYLNYTPILIGGDWHFKTGRYMYWPHETPVSLLVPEGYADLCGKPHQLLLVSICQAMGLDVDYVGLDHMWGQRGDRVDCRGPLPGLIR